MKITIVGSGNAGCAHAFKFSEIGHEVTLLKTSNSMHNNNFTTIEKNKGIWCIDNTNGQKESFQKIHLITKNIKSSVKNAELIVVLTQSLQHENVARLICPHITNKTKMILIIPGNLGSLIFKKYLGSLNLILAEGESTPFDARIVEPGKINIIFKNKRNALAFLPASQRETGLKIASTLVDTYKYYRKNIVESAMNNPNLIVHTVGTIFSASRIENMKGEFWMYKEGFSPAIWRLINNLDQEKNEIIGLFGGKRVSYLDACKFRNEENLSLDSLGVFNSYAKSGSPKGPDSLNTRYLYEDVLTGLCTMSLLGSRFNVKTPIANSLIYIASALLEYDFFSEARTFETFGLNEFSNEDIIKLVNN